MNTITAKASGVTVTFDGAIVELTHGGFLSQVGRCTKRIPVGQITAVQWKKAGPRGGLIQFTISGGVENRSRKGGNQITDARKDPNSATFSAGRQEQEFLVLRNAVEAAITNPAPAQIQAVTPVAVPVAGPSVVEQIRQLSQLRDAGALTDDEFVAFKNRMLLG
jgi:hypothetical protein